MSASASSALFPHTEGSGLNPRQTGGYSGVPQTRHLPSGSRLTQRTPAGFPDGIPGSGLEMEGAMQQAAQPTRQSMKTA